MPPSPRRTPPLAALLLALACSSGGGSSPGDSGGTITAPDTAAGWCDAYHASLAARWAACHHGGLAWAQALFDPAQLCADPVKAVAAGRAAYDRAAASTCFSFLGAADCTTLDGLIAGTAWEASCGGAIAGTTAVAGACFTDSDCASARCDTSVTCPGTCTAASSSEGLPCQDRRDCAPGFFCGRSKTLGYLTCEPLSAYPGLGGQCSAGVSPCQPGLYCDGSVTPNVCRTLKTGGACASTGECAPGLWCRGGTCVPVPGPTDACPQVLDACGPGLYCGAASVCVDEVAVGQTCTVVGGYFAGCILGTCQAGTGTCLPMDLSGDPCATDLACAPGWVCRKGVCAAPGCAEP